MKYLYAPLAMAFLVGLAPAQAKPPVFSSDESSTITAGMTAWRKPDANGISCMQCHTPFAYDIAQFNFTRQDVRVAASPHVSQAEADAVYDMIEVYRAKYPPAGGVKDFRTFRPLQPGGGVVVGGEDASSDVRDAAFGFQLRQRFRFAGDRIRTLAESRAAADELINVRVADIPVGIRFNHWSRSVLREGAVVGGEIAEWLPSAGLVARPEYASQWLALQDAYRADPSTVNMWAIYQAMGTMVDLDAHNFIPGQTHANWKYVILGQHYANLVFAHDELLKARGLPSLLAAEDGVRPFRSVRDTVTANLAPFWNVGDNARVVQFRPFNELPLRNQESIYLGPDHNTQNVEFCADQVQDFRLTWFWMGWMQDNSLRFSGEGSTLSGEYFIGSLWTGETGENASHGMRMHQVFFNAVQQYKLGFQPGAVRDGQPQRFDSRKGYYLGYDRWRPKDAVLDIGLPGANVLYQRLLSNHLRMNLLVHNDELRRIGTAYMSDEEKGWLYSDIELWRDALHWADRPWTSEDDALLNTLKSTVQGTVRSLPPFITASGGAYDLTRRVTLAPMSAAATIRYTTDGTAPGAASSQIYGAPFSVPNGTLVRAAAIENGLPVSFEVNADLSSAGGADQLFAGYTPSSEEILGQPSERGVRFRVDVPGVATEVRYYRTANETGAHAGRLWQASGAYSGTLLASTAFPAANDAPGAGWRSVPLVPPVLLTPGRTYVVSVNANSASADIQNGLDASHIVGALASFSQGNGVFAAVGAFPTQADGNTNYLRDLTFVAVTPREAWRLGQFGSVVQNGAAADLADPDGDGYVNLLEYALNGSPLAADGRPLFNIARDAAGRLNLSFLRARADIEYAVEGSSDLQIWQTLVLNPGTVGQAVTVFDDPPLGATRRFLRLRASAP